VQAIATHPRILERPILVAGDRAVLARPPERVLALVAQG
jgi:arsenate reductase